MTERRSLLLPRKWKLLFGFLGFSGIVSTAGFLVGGGKAWSKWDAMQAQLTTISNQYAAQVKLNGEFRGRIAELTTSENQLRAVLNLPPLVHQSILDGTGDAQDRPAPLPRETLQAVLPVAQRRAGRP